MIFNEDLKGVKNVNTFNMQNGVKIGIFLVFTVIVLCLVNSSYAATKSVSGTTFVDIHKTINSANSRDIITLSNTTYKGTGSEINVNKSNIVIQGPSSSKYATLDGENKRCIFYVTGTNVTIKYITITRGNYTTSAGACIQWNANNGKLQNSIVKNCYGRGLAGYGANPYIDSCTFDSNIGNSGAGVYIGSGISGSKIINSKFINNKATRYK